MVELMARHALELEMLQSKLVAAKSGAGGTGKKRAPTTVLPTHSNPMAVVVVKDALVRRGGAVNENETEKEAKALPAGWEEHTDDAGAVFYHNEATGKTLWSHPADVAATPPDPTLPEGWEAHTDAKGTVFYNNEATGETSWKHPNKVRTTRLPRRRADVASGAATIAHRGGASSRPPARNRSQSRRPLRRFAARSYRNSPPSITPLSSPHADRRSALHSFLPPRRASPVALGGSSAPASAEPIRAARPAPRGVDGRDGRRRQSVLP
jgi:hypothetical protein